jgi:hypothetical protein
VKQSAYSGYGFRLPRFYFYIFELILSGIFVTFASIFYLIIIGSMTQITLNTPIDQSKIAVLTALFKSWGIKAKVEDAEVKSAESEDAFALTRGLWADYDYDYKKARQESYERRTQSHLQK